ncbi:MAG TPA: alpha/beta fold hydrolase [Actinomycetota bacterium]
MQGRTIGRREAIRYALASCVGAAFGGSILAACNDRPPRMPNLPCEQILTDPAIGFGISVLTPVFWGYADYQMGTAPANMRVYYPSFDGAPLCAPFAGGPGHFPLVMFLHGQCDEATHYLDWSHLPPVLARSGFVVCVPDLSAIGNPSQTGSSTYTRITDCIDWMRSSWSHRDYLMSEASLGIVGHSYGALHGGQLANTIPASVFVSLGGVWTDWTPLSSWPIGSMTAPKLLVWGASDGQATLPDANFESLPAPRHRLVFDGGHWDYLPPAETNCDPGPGPCALFHEVVADISALYLSKYMWPEEAGFLTGYIPDDLVPPTVSRSRQQQFFAGGTWLSSFDRARSHPGCSSTLTWATPEATGSRTIPG